MAERRATNKYYPPDWDPSKGSINTFVGQHPLRERARKLHEGILIVRFELPFNIWCLGCNEHVGQGVRYNAEKKKAGNYYSTPIWSFRMRCHLCSNWIEIHTDPKNSEYVVVSGARRKVETYDAKEAGVIELPDNEKVGKIANNAFYKLEHETKDQQKAEIVKPLLTKLQEVNDRQCKYDYESSMKLRKKFRLEKKDRLREQAESEDLAKRRSLDLRILPSAETDKLEAKKIQFAGSLVDAKRKRLKLQNSDIFVTEATSQVTRTIQAALKRRKIEDEINEPNESALVSKSFQGNGRAKECTNLRQIGRSEDCELRRPCKISSTVQNGTSLVPYNVDDEDDLPTDPAAKIT